MFTFKGTVIAIEMLDKDYYNIKIQLETGTGLTLPCEKEGKVQIGDIIEFTGELTK